MTLYPSSLGYRFPAEWEPHRATWLSWPHKEASWPGKIQAIYPVYAAFIRILSLGEQVCINVNSPQMQREAEAWIARSGADLSRVEFFLFPTDDAWCRDHGPAFLVNPHAAIPKVIIDWGFNAWGNKYPPYTLDDQIPSRIGKWLGIPVYHPGIIMEGGSVDFNGAGTLITTTSCLLHPNRNPGLSQREIEDFLHQYYGVDQILWLGDGIAGDDTDGHIDDLTRFVGTDTVVTVVERDRSDENYKPLQQNLSFLKKIRLPGGRQLEIVELPMPAPLFWEGMRLPASYANFYIANEAVVVPTFRDEPRDRKALEVLGQCFKDRKVIGLDGFDLVWGLGTFHCLSQQEPL